MRKLAIAAACLAVAAPVYAETISESTGLNSATGTAPSTADFVKEAAVSDMFEIGSSRLAEQKGNEPAKTFASEMVKDHSKTSSELKSLVGSGKVKATLPADMDQTHKDMLAKLQRLSGKDFVQQYDSDQVSAHKTAVDLFKRYANGGDNPALKKWAAQTLPTLEHHLQMAQTNYKNS